jgi:hypothetical protein
MKVRSTSVDWTKEAQVQDRQNLVSRKKKKKKRKIKSNRKTKKNPKAEKMNMKLND